MRESPDRRALGPARLRQPATLEPVSPLRGGYRKLRPLYEVALRNPAASRTRESFVARAQRLGEEAGAATVAIEVARVLWKMESLAFARFRRAPDEIEDLLREMPREAQTMAHTAVGQTAVVLHGFDAGRVSDFIDSVSDPRFRSFSYEALGSVLGLFFPRRFRHLSTLLGRLGVVARVPGDAPVPDAFLGELPAAGRRLAAHGCGRIVYLRGTTHRSALSQAARHTDLETAACQSGVAGAYALVNSRNLRAVLGLADSTSDPELQHAIRDGLMNALTLVAWTRPGVLDGSSTGEEASSSLVEAAVARADSARQHGDGPPWAWEEP